MKEEYFLNFGNKKVKCTRDTEQSPRNISPEEKERLEAIEIGDLIAEETQIGKRPEGGGKNPRKPNLDERDNQGPDIDLNKIIGKIK